MVRPADASGAGRLLAFEVARCLYALPIESVLEVAEAERATCVPGLRTDMAGVMNWHGDPLPIVASDRLLARDGAAADEATPARGVLREQVLVLSDRGDEAARLGIPVDRVVGLIEGRAPLGRATDLVVERRPVDGRVVAVLDPRLLVARAGDIIERAVA
ncbi:MAG TPA: chemotaxis protein CheW [Alphaproteobacteria bacterium]|nr:chemotaxis protein CheW [Alphaproteobacteria bacterium]